MVFKCRISEYHGSKEICEICKREGIWTDNDTAQMYSCTPHDYEVDTVFVCEEHINELLEQGPRKT